MSSCVGVPGGGLGVRIFGITGTVTDCVGRGFLYVLGGLLMGLGVEWRG